MNEREEDLPARDARQRHLELYEAEYARQLERIARIRAAVTAALPAVRPARPVHERADAQWDATPDEVPETPAAEPAAAQPAGAAQAGETAAEPDADAAPADARPGGVIPFRLGRRDPRRAKPSAPARQEPPPADVVALRDPGGAGTPARTRGATGRPYLFAAVAALLLLVGLAVLLDVRGENTIAPTVFHVSGQPTGIAAGGGEVWVAGPAAGMVWVLDAASGKPAAPTVVTGGAPARIALDNRSAWIADTQRGAVVRVPRRNTAGDRPSTISVGPDVSDLVTAHGALWTTSSADGTVRVIAGHTRTTLHAGVHPVALAADATRVVVADSVGTLLRFDARRRRAIGPSVRLGGTPIDVAVADGRAFVADAASGSIRPVDLADGEVGLSVTPCHVPIAIAADDAAIYVACRDDRTLATIDPKTGGVIGRSTLPVTPTALALDPRHVWIAAGSHEVIRVDR